MDWEPRVGMRVVHVSKWTGSRLSKKFEGARMPAIGCVYTVRTVSDFGDVVLLRLCEIDNSHLNKGGPEPGFNTTGFRPLDERRLDVFREMLAPTPKQPVRSDA